MVDEKRVNGNVVQKHSGYTGKYLHPENGIELCGMLQYIAGLLNKGISLEYTVQ